MESVRQSIEGFQSSIGMPGTPSGALMARWDQARHRRAGPPRRQSAAPVRLPKILIHGGLLPSGNAPVKQCRNQAAPEVHGSSEGLPGLESFNDGDHQD